MWLSPKKHKKDRKLNEKNNPKLEHRLTPNNKKYLFKQNSIELDFIKAKKKTGPYLVWLELKKHVCFIRAGHSLASQAGRNNWIIRSYYTRPGERFMAIVSEPVYETPFLD